MKEAIMLLRMTYVCTAETDCNICATWNATSDPLFEVKVLKSHVCAI